MAAGELDNFFKELEARKIAWLCAGQLRLVTDYVIGVDTTLGKASDPKATKFLLPAETHFFLEAVKTPVEDYRIMYLDNGIALGVSNEQVLPVKKTEATQGL